MVRDRMGALKSHMAFFRNTFLCVSLMLVISGCSPRVELPVQPNLDGVEIALRKFLEDRYKQVLDLPNSGTVRGRLAMAYDANRFYVEAISTYTEAATLSPDDFRWPYFLSIVLAETGDLSSAVSIIGKALKIDGLYVPARLRKAVWLIYAREYQRADTELQELLTFDISPELRSLGNMARGRSLVGLTRYEEATELLEPLLGGPLNSQAKHALRAAYRHLGRIKELRQLGKSVEEVRYDWSDHRRDEIFASVRGISGEVRLAETLLSYGEIDRALKLLKKLSELRPEDPALLNNLATAYTRNDQLQAAFQTYSEAIEMHENYFPLYFNLASAYELSGDRGKALEQLERVLELQPGMNKALQRRAIILGDLGRYDEALVAMKEAEIAGAGTAEMSLYAGLIRGSQGRWKEAVNEFENALEIDPRMARSHLFLGHTLIEMGLFDKAESALERAEIFGAEESEISSARKRLSELEIVSQIR